MKRTLPRRAGVVVASALVMLGVGLASAIAPGRAQDAQAPAFVELKDVVAAASAATTERLLFLPLDESFDSCIPLRVACPEDSSTLMLVPAQGRALSWRPEGSELHVVELDAPPVPAIGLAPERHESVRYLVPVLEGSGIQLLHMPRRYADGRLVDDAGPDQGTSSESGAGSDAGGSPAEAVTPVLGGSLLSTAQPAPPPDRLLHPPVLIERSDLTDATPALLVRRSAPTRIVFGVRPDPAWGLDTSYVPVLDAGMVAVGGRHDGQVGLAVPAPPDLDEEAVERLSQRASDTAPDSRWRSPRLWLIGGAIAIGAAATAAAVVGRARRRRPGEHPTSSG